MTTPAAVETAPLDDAPIPDDLLATALTARANSTGLEGDDPELATADDAPAPDAPDAADPPDPDAASGADSTTLDGDAPAADPPPADPFADLLKDATPLTFKVNGAERTFDHILEVPGKGGLIPADKLAEVRNTIARSESNADAYKVLSAEKQRYDRLGGYDGILQKLEVSAQTDAAALHILEAVMRDPTQFVTVENGQIVPNAHAIQMLRKESVLAANEAKWTVRQQRETTERTWQTETSEQETRATAIPNAVQSVAQRYGLSAEDIDAATRHFNAVGDALLFKATPEQAAQYGVPVGTLMVDLPKMQPWFEDRAALRKQQAEQASAREQAAKENAKRVPAKPVSAKPKPKAQVPRNEDGTFAERRLDPSEIFDNVRSGKSALGRDHDD